MSEEKKKSEIPYKIEIKSINDIKFREDNPRFHSEENKALIRKSLRRNRAGRSILIDENMETIAGEGTTRSAIEEGIENVIIIETTGKELVAVKRIDLDENQKQELIFLDNRANETSEWDNQKTAAMLQKLKENGIELDNVGFTQDDFEHFLTNANFKESDFDGFFKDDDNEPERTPKTVTITFIFPKKKGESVLKKLSEFDEKLETALLKALKL